MPPEPSPHDVTTEITEGASQAEPSSLTTKESDVVGPETGAAPTYRSPLPPPIVSSDPFAFARPGVRFHDFELIKELGSGAFGKVFLARQISLERSVALKITRRSGGHEARTLAHLEHDYIVRVFSETIDQERGVFLLCMQYVAGTTLARVIDALSLRARDKWSGRAIVEAVDSMASGPAVFDPAALRDREVLAACDFPEAVCWIGSCLALALAHAHAHGVMHRDVKPANILLNRYGRPMLVDFNIAFDPRQSRAASGGMFGGTLAYMAPEHLAAFNAEASTPPEAVDERSDVYSLGLVVFELLTGKRPFRRRPEDGESTRGALLAMIAERRSGPPAVPDLDDAGCLEPVIRRCLDPDPANRYQDAGELAGALEGCRELHRMQKRLPAPGPLTRFATKHPFWCLAGLALLPHLLGSLVNIWYNDARIHLSPVQEAAFRRVTLGYNAVVYPIAGCVLYWLFAPLYRAWRDRDARGVDNEDARRLRRRLLRLPFWVALLSAIGWVPGGLLFPWAIDRTAGPIGPDIFSHYFVSFTISGLIALTYSVLVVQFVSLRILYPRFCGDGQCLLAGETGIELRPVERRLLVLQLLAVAIPLVGAVLMTDVGPESFSREGYREFRVLVTSLITLGMAGFTIALSASTYLRKTISALSSAERTPTGRTTMITPVSRKPIEQP
jgi:serine/threonine protein kinase